METIAFDTLAYSKQLIAAGLDEKIAETHAKMQVKILKNMLTKNDIDFASFVTHQDLLTLEQRLIEKFMLHINTATSDRQVIRGEARQGFTTATADRQTIRNEMAQGFAANLADHQVIRDEMRAGFAANAVDHQMLRNEMKSLQLQTIGILGSMMVAGFSIIGVIIHLTH